MKIPRRTCLRTNTSLQKNSCLRKVTGPRRPLAPRRRSLQPPCLARRRRPQRAAGFRKVSVSLGDEKPVRRRQPLWLRHRRRLRRARHSDARLSRRHRPDPGFSGQSRELRLRRRDVFNPCAPQERPLPSYAGAADQAFGPLGFSQFRMGDEPLYFGWQTIYAVVHDEFRGGQYSQWANVCKDDVIGSQCFYSSLTLATSNDGGSTFTPATPFVIAAPLNRSQAASSISGQRAGLRWNR